MASFKVDAAPEVLEWARRSIGLTREQAAKKVDVSPGQIEEWEEGADDPTLAQMRRMAEAYKRPLAVLLLPAAPQDFEPIRDFRLLPANQDRPRSPELQSEIRRVQMQRAVARELAEIADDMPPLIDLAIRLSDDPEIAGEIIRQWLGPLRGTATSDLNRWTEAIEGKSILVTQITRVKLEEMRGCSISEEPFPAIILNGADAPRGKLFTLLHELNHILLRSSALCDLAETASDPKTDRERIERFCNQVAAATLIPRVSLMRDMRVASASANSEWPDEELARLAIPYGVSQEAMLRRLVSLGRTSWGFYVERRMRYLEAYQEERQRRKEKKSGGPGPYTMNVRDFGRRYVGTVLDAYYRSDITGSDLADYLRMKINQVPRLEMTLDGRR
jgi:Zn-dependent peptidase ImmA (M78 family)/DNA-binding XRE family transcriptional regulator